MKYNIYKCTNCNNHVIHKNENIKCCCGNRQFTIENIQELINCDFLTLTLFFLKTLKIGDIFNINNIEYTIIKGRKNKNKYFIPLYGIKSNKKTLYLYNLYNVITSSENRLMEWNNLQRDIEGVLILDKINSNNIFHKKSNIFEKLKENILIYNI